MADRELKLQVVWSMLEKITSPLKNITGTSKVTARALKETRDRLKELNDQQKQIGEFRELSAGLRAGETRLKEAQQRVRELAQQMQATENPTRTMTREFDRAVNKARAIKEANQQQSQQLQVLRDRMYSAGISASNLGEHERALRRSIEATNGQLSQQQQKLAAVTRQQERMMHAQHQMHKAHATSMNLMMAGAGASTVGAAAAVPVSMAVSEAKRYSTEMQRMGALGLGDKVSVDALKFSKGLKTYGTSALDNLQLMRDAMTVFADEHHAEMVTPMLAKMKFANTALYGEEKGADNERKFMDMLKVIELRGGLASKQEFERQANIVQQVLTATGGRVGPEEWLNVIKTGGIAAKGMKDDAFYYQLEALVQEMGGHRVGTALMSAYSNLYQGRTTKRSALKLEEFGLIGDMSKVKHDKAGQISFLNPGALLGADLFRENQFAWMEQVLLPQLAKKGITEKSQVLDAIGSMFSNRTASNLFSQMYLQREQIHKNAALNQGADNVDRLYFRAKQTPSGQELEAMAKVRDLQLEMGNQVLPLYAGALESVAGALKSITGFMKEHETVAKVTIVTLGALAGLLLVIGPLMLGIASIIGPYALLRYTLTAAGAKGLTLMPILRALGVESAGAGGKAGILASSMEKLRTVAPAVGQKVAAAWRAADPRVVGSSMAGYVKSLGEKIPAAGRAAWLSTVAWSKELGGTLKSGLANAATGVSTFTMRIWASVVAMHAAAAARWSNAGGAAGLFKAGTESIIGGVASGLRMVGQVLLFVGRAALMNPIGLLITGIAAAALLIVKYWEPIKAFFSGMWEGFKAGLAPLSPMFNSVFGGLGTALAPLKPVWDWIVGALSSAWEWVSRLFAPFKATSEQLANATDKGYGFGAWLASLVVTLAELTGKFFQFGADIVTGLINGIKSMGGAVRDAIMGLAGGAIDWFKEKLGIHSPSRVFADFGGYITQGLAVGIDRGQDQPLAQVSGMAKRLAQLGAGIAIGTAGTAAMSSMAFDTRPPLAARGAPTMSVGGDTININIYPTPNTDTQAIACAVSAELDRRDREKAARMRSSLHDY